jgi:hypothetical protein
MKSEADRAHSFEDHAFLLLIVIVTIAFGWILQPFYGAVLWAIVAWENFTSSRQLRQDGL